MGATASGVLDALLRQDGERSSDVLQARRSLRTLLDGVGLREQWRTRCNLRRRRWMHVDVRLARRLAGTTSSTGGTYARFFAGRQTFATTGRMGASSPGDKWR
jgi:hypothetical protein